MSVLRGIVVMFSSSNLSGRRSNPLLPEDGNPGHSFDTEGSLEVQPIDSRTLMVVTRAYHTKSQINIIICNAKE